MSNTILALLLGLDCLPLGSQLFLAVVSLTGEDMGVAAYQFLVDGADDIRQFKHSQVLVYFGDHDEDVQQVAKLFADIVRILVSDGGEQFIALRLKMLHQAVAGLFLVPGAAAGASEGGDGVAKGL